MSSTAFEIALALECLNRGQSPKSQKFCTEINLDQMAILDKLFLDGRAVLGVGVSQLMDFGTVGVVAVETIASTKRR